nr:MAG TPA: hypothetical protein [Caudoviricetes sp.]
MLFTPEPFRWLYVTSAQRQSQVVFDLLFNFFLLLTFTPASHILVTERSDPR